MLRIDRRMATTALLVALLALDGCASKTDFDSESHFVCSNDYACKRLGDNYACVARQCTLHPLVDGGAEGGAAGGSSGAGGGGGKSGGTASSGGDANDGGHRDDGASSVPDAGTSSGGGAPIIDDGGTPADARAPALAPIVGFTSSGIGGLAFVRVDPVTGDESHSVPLPDLFSISQGITGWNPTTGRFYALVDLIDQTHHLLGLDAATGAIISSPLVDLRLIAAEVDGKGGIFGMAATGVTADGFVSQSVSPDTGVGRTLSDLPGSAFPIQGMSAIDEAGGRYYHAIATETGESRILTLDTATGHIISNVPTDSSIYDIEVDADGRLVAFVPGENSELRFLDPVTGTTRFIASVGTSSLNQGDSAIDRAAGVMYQTSYGPGSGSWLLAVDLASGHVTQVPLAHELGEIVVCTTCT